MFEDIFELAGPNAFQMLPQIEAQFNVNLKQDILSKLSGEVAFELQTPPVPPQGTSSGMTASPGNFKVILSVSDPAGLQQKIKRFLEQEPIQSGERVDEGITFDYLAT